MNCGLVSSLRGDNANAFNQPLSIFFKIVSWISVGGRCVGSQTVRWPLIIFYARSATRECKVNTNVSHKRVTIKGDVARFILFSSTQIWTVLHTDEIIFWPRNGFTRKTGLLFKTLMSKFLRVIFILNI